MDIKSNLIENIFCGNRLLSEYISSAAGRIMI